MTLTKPTQYLEWRPFSLQGGPAPDVLDRCWVIDGNVDAVLFFDPVEHIFYRASGSVQVAGWAKWDQLRLPVRAHRPRVRE